jgi:hypothetical protein
MLCPGSLDAEKGLPYTTSVHAETGTMLHDRVNRLITVESSSWAKDLTEEQQVAVINAAAYYNNLKDTKLEIVKEIHEQTFSLDFLMPGMQGTADSVLILYDKLENICQIHVIDYKFGIGVPVKARDNYQLMLYALGVYMHPEINNIVKSRCNLGSSQQPFRFTTAHLHIVQPYIENSRWDLSREELTSLITGSRMQLIKQSIINASEPDAVRIPSKKACQFCKAKATCYALKSMLPVVDKSSSKGLIEAKVRLLTDDEIADIYEKKELINMYLKAIEEYIKDRLLAGEFPNYTLRPKLSNRKWGGRAEEFLRSKLGDNAYEITKKLIPIGKAEKLLGKDAIKRLIIRTQGEDEIVKIEYSLDNYLN